MADSERAFGESIHSCLREAAGGNDRTETVRSLELDGDSMPLLAVDSEDGLVVAATDENTFPCRKAVLDAARSAADRTGADRIVTCNPTDLFAFETSDHGYATSGYVDLREQTLTRAVGSLVSDAGDAVDRSGDGRSIGIVRSFRSSTGSTYRRLAAEDYEAAGNEAFTRAVDAWTDRCRRGDASDSERFDLIANRYAFLLAASVLARNFDEGPAPSPSEVLTARSTGEYGSISDWDGHGIFTSFPQDESTRDAVEGMVELTRSDRLAAPDAVTLGQEYEAFVPEDERGAFGQFYTPPGIAETLCRWAIERPDRDRDDATDSDGSATPAGEAAEDDSDRALRVLDPACGSGLFVAAARETLGSIADETPRDRPAGRIVGLDVDPLSLRTTALGLTGSTDGPAADVDLRHTSFFDAEGTQSGGFDAIVGNPPYVRHEDLTPDKSHFRDHLAAFGPDGETPYLDGQQALSRRSDAYVYFVTRAAELLREGGRLAFVLPTKWLTAEYGEPFRAFLHDHFAIEGVVGFDRRAFDDALVDTSLLLLERRADERARRETTTAFVRVEEPMDPGTVLDAVDISCDPDSPDTVRDRTDRRVIAADQSYLAESGPRKLSPFLRAPETFVRLLDHPAMVPLGELGDVHRGVMTGANDFFFLDEADREEWSIDDRFLRPAIKSLRGVDERVLRAADVDRYLFDVHAYVAAVEATGGDRSDSEDRVLAALEDDGYEGARRYIEWGRERGFDERSSCATRRVWFDLGELDPPAILHPKFFDDRVDVVWNPDRLMPGNAVDCVTLREGVDESAMLGVLNSTVHRAMLETWGRAEGGGALQVMTYEVSTVPVVDVRKLDETTRREIAKRYEALVAGAQNAQTDLDRLVLDILGVDATPEAFRERYETMVERRTAKGGDASVLVGGDRGDTQPAHTRGETIADGPVSE